MSNWLLIQHGICRYRFGLSLYLWLLLCGFLNLTFPEGGVIGFTSMEYGATIWGGLILYWIMRRTHYPWIPREALGWHRRTVFYSLVGSYVSVSIVMYWIWSETGLFCTLFAFAILLPVAATGYFATKRELRQEADAVSNADVVTSRLES